jgi:hypothetical protein
MIRGAEKPIIPQCGSIELRQAMTEHSHGATAQSGRKKSSNCKGALKTISTSARWCSFRSGFVQQLVTVHCKRCHCVLHNRDFPWRLNAMRSGGFHTVYWSRSSHGWFRKGESYLVAYAACRGWKRKFYACSSSQPQKPYNVREYDHFDSLIGSNIDGKLYFRIELGSTPQSLLSFRVGLVWPGHGVLWVFFRVLSCNATFLRGWIRGFA